ncbi:putative indole-3-pyruvate monooxygenase yucca10 [Nicotiana attenuata]|uniref:indole-3-pyruvate monooxygenase n=1 Tax=Nicotiana attenuata TaxID=49451 RepID=A0A1J6IET4_NICAT|nr:putative indole-3-pyruvate monooxygenase yucca10 [Nicotiana attenuata]
MSFAFTSNCAFEESTRKWIVKVRNDGGEYSGNVKEYSGRFLVVETGEFGDAFIPNVSGIESFNGEIMHSTQYKNGEKFKAKNVLVVGSGNSGMEIALDAANCGAKTSIIIRSPVIVELVHHLDTCIRTWFSYLLLRYTTQIVKCEFK